MPIVGDFRNYVLARRGGMTVRLDPAAAVGHGGAWRAYVKKEENDPMPLSTSSVPHFKEPTVSDKPTEPAKVAKPAAAPLARASESGDPAVHALMAQADIHRQNGDDEALAAAVKQLAELGYE